MSEKSLFFSLLFFTAFLIQIALAFNSLFKNPRKQLNRIFFMLCLSLAFWSLGFSFATSAASLEKALLWRRFSALGWGSVYAFILHFFITFTNFPLFDKQKNLRLFLLYLPALFALGVFSLLGSVANWHYQLQRGPYGWVNIVQGNILDSFFVTYYISYILISLALVIWWMRKNAGDESIKKQGQLLLLSFSTALILGSITDIFFSAKLRTILPQLGPVVILIPAASIFYLIRNYDFLKSKTYSGDELILSSHTRSRLYYFVSLIFLFAGMVSLFIYFFPFLTESNYIPVTSSYVVLVFFVMAFLVLLTQLINSEAMRTSMVVLVIATSFPLIILQYIDNAGVTIWAFPIVFMIVSLLFNNSKPLVFLVAIAIATQVFLLQHSGYKTIEMDIYDYLVRIVIFILVLFVGSFVNRVYIKRLQENLYQTEFQKMLSSISFSFASIDQININEEVSGMLKKVGEFFDLDRTYIYIRGHDQRNLTFGAEWFREGIPKRGVNFQDLIREDFFWSLNEFSTSKIINIADISKMPQEANREKKILEDEGVKSLLVIPLEDDGKVTGFLGMETVSKNRKWSDYELELLKIISKLLADGLLKIGSKEAMEFMAYYDQLTELANRRLFSDRLDQSIKMAERNGSFIGVVMIDLDSFKIVNDTMGHSGGDLLLKEVAGRLQEYVRQTDTVARFGGDEFLIMLNNIKEHHNIANVAHKIMEAFKQPFKINDQDFFISASAGVSVYPLDGTDVESLIKNADTTLYIAKEKGKNQVAMCTEAIKESALVNVQLSNSLYRVEERGELEVYYQPQIDLESGKISGLEALIRWNHPEKGQIAPGIFIPLAEMNGTINKIGQWILEEAISQNKKWQDMGYDPVRLAVNLSAVQLINPNFINIVEDILSRVGMAPQYLELEITESEALSEASDILQSLQKLQNKGVQVAIDDFGTEYSSLKRLKELPFDRLKIDIDFVRGIDKNEKDQAIVKTIIKLAKNLKAKVIAEGVETASQLSFLCEKGSDEVQGYFFYKPMPAAEIEKLLAAGIEKKEEIKCIQP